MSESEVGKMTPQELKEKLYATFFMLEDRKWLDLGRQFTDDWQLQYTHCAQYDPIGPVLTVHVCEEGDGEMTDNIYAFDKWVENGSFEALGVSCENIWQGVRRQVREILADEIETKRVRDRELQQYRELREKYGDLDE